MAISTLPYAIVAAGNVPSMLTAALALLPRPCGSDRAPDIWSSSAVANKIDASGQVATSVLLFQQVAGWGDGARPPEP